MQLGQCTPIYGLSYYSIADYIMYNTCLHILHTLNSAKRSSLSSEVRFPNCCLLKKGHKQVIKNMKSGGCRTSQHQFTKYTYKVATILLHYHPCIGCCKLQLHFIVYTICLCLFFQQTQVLCTLILSCNSLFLWNECSFTSKH